MSHLWLYFAAMFSVQILLFLFHAYWEKKLASVPRILLLAAVIGAVSGPMFDLIGKKFDLFSYALGFGPLNLFATGLFLYGLYYANILLMQKVRLSQFLLRLTVIVGIFEIMNLFLPLWTYTHVVPSLEYLVIAFVCPLVIAVIIAAACHKLFGYRFAFIINKGQ